MAEPENKPAQTFEWPLSPMFGEVLRLDEKQNQMVLARQKADKAAGLQTLYGQAAVAEGFVGEPEVERAAGQQGVLRLETSLKAIEEIRAGKTPSGKLPSPTFDNRPSADRPTPSTAVNAAGNLMHNTALFVAAHPQSANDENVRKATDAGRAYLEGVKSGRSFDAIGLSRQMGNGLESAARAGVEPSKLFDPIMVGRDKDLLLSRYTDAKQADASAFVSNGKPLDMTPIEPKASVGQTRPASGQMTEPPKSGASEPASAVNPGGTIAEVSKNSEKTGAPAAASVDGKVDGTKTTAPATSRKEPTKYQRLGIEDRESPLKDATEKGIALRYGDEGKSVKELQAALKKGGFYKGDIDGKFFGQTRDAVNRFQRSEIEAGHSIGAHQRADGSVGAKTFERIAKLDSAHVDNPHASKAAPVTPLPPRRPKELGGRD